MISLGPRRTDRRPAAASASDEGSVLVLVLVLMIVGALMVLPLMDYAISVSRSNSALSDKTRRIEALKAGLRVALADPVGLYDTCGTQAGLNNPLTLASPGIAGVTVTTKCYFIDFAAAQSDDEKYFGLGAVQVGQVVPPELKGTPYATANPSDPHSWLNDITTGPVTGKVWLPNLPSHALNRRSPAGYQMPVGYPACTVYFPGTYADPLTISGPTYFTSGIYYFEQPITINSGANVVVGQGAVTGCSTDQESAFYAVGAPSTHNINGLGGTFVFGDAARLIVHNATGPVSLQFNQRYVQPGDASSAPSESVSLMTVNGKLNGTTGGPVDLANLLYVPLSLVGSDGAEDAIAEQYKPATSTPDPRAPGAPTAVTGTALNAAVRVSWTAPTSTGGLVVDSYTATASPSGLTCTAIGTTSCTITGLANSTAYKFTVTATNALGTSAASAQSSSITPLTSKPAVAAPGKPASISATPYKASARVTWTVPASDGNAPVTGYTVTASPGTGLGCTTAQGPYGVPLTCDVAGLTNATAYTFTVTATNQVGTSVASNASAAVTPQATLANPPALPGNPPPAPYVPDPVVDIDLAGSQASTIVIPGYVAVPQGRFRISNPNGLAVTVSGGVLAASFDVQDSRAAGAGSLDIGFIESIVQRKFRIVSSTGPNRSTAIVQINQNGAYAINAWEVQ